MKLSKLIIKTLLFCAFYSVIGNAADNEVYIACNSFETKRVSLQRACSAAEEIELYDAIYAESGFRNSWFSSASPDMVLFQKQNMSEEQRVSLEKDGIEIIFDTDHKLIQKRDRDYFQAKERLRFYQFPMSFPDYVIRSKETNKLVGKFIFKDHVKDGRVENGIYLFKEFRKKGLGAEILTGVLKNIIDPAIGRSFIISYFPQDFAYSTQYDFEVKIFQNFRGVYSCIAPFYNYPSLSANCKVGCSISWRKLIPYAFYPQGDETCMDLKDIESFKGVIRLMFQLNMASAEKKSHIQQPASFFFQFLGFIKANPYKDAIADNLTQLVGTKDPLTLISAQEALNLLSKELDIDAENLSES